MATVTPGASKVSSRCSPCARMADPTSWSASTSRASCASMSRHANAERAAASTASGTGSTWSNILATRLSSLASSTDSPSDWLRFISLFPPVWTDVCVSCVSSRPSGLPGQPHPELIQASRPGRSYRPDRHAEDGADLGVALQRSHRQDAQQGLAALRESREGLPELPVLVLGDGLG